MVPVVLFFSLAAQPGVDGVDTAATWLLVNLLSLAATGVVFAVAKTMLSASPHTVVSLGPLVGIGAVLGGVKGVTTGVGGVAFGLEADLIQAILSRAPQATVLGALVVGAVSVAAHARHVLHDRRRIAVATALSERLNHLHHIEQLDAPLVRRALADTRTALAQADRDQMTYREVADSVVRPLSHELWGVQRGNAPRFTLREVYRRAMSRKAFSPVAVGVVWFLTSTPGLIRDNPLAPTLAVTALMALGYAGIIWLIRRAPLTAAPAVILLVASGLAAVTALVAGFGMWWWGESFPLDTVGVQLAGWLWAVMVTIGAATVATVFSLERDSSTTLAGLLTEDDISPVTVSAFEETVAKRLATFLHGEVVNKLLTLSRRTSAPSSEDDALAEVTKREIIRQLESGAWLTSPVTRTGGVADRLAEIATAWAGVVEVTMSGTEVLGGLSAMQEANLVEAVGEAISNAHRHGFATSVQVSFDPTPSGGMRVTVLDNGVGLRQGERGVGSRLYDQLSAGRWTLVDQPSGGGALLTLVVGAQEA